jgi:hypothetical protein
MQIKDKVAARIRNLVAQIDLQLHSNHNSPFLRQVSFKASRIVGVIENKRRQKLEENQEMRMVSSVEGLDRFGVAYPQSSLDKIRLAAILSPAPTKRS